MECTYRLIIVNSSFIKAILQSTRVNIIILLRGIKTTLVVNFKFSFFFLRKHRYKMYFRQFTSFEVHFHVLPFTLYAVHLYILLFTSFAVYFHILPFSACVVYFHILPFTFFAVQFGILFLFLSVFFGIRPFT